MHRLFVLLACHLAIGAAAAASASPATPIGSPPGTEPDTVRYPASFFEAYRPVSAGDMVEQVPGFQIDDGGTSRGFAGTAGNVLIDGERPSSKQDPVSEILERIPADRVVRIDLIRGNTGRFDAGGQTLLVNVVLDASRRAWTWQGSVEQDTDSGGPTPAGTLSVVDRIGRTRIGAGISARTSFVGNSADEFLLVGDAVAETRDEVERWESRSATLNANSATQLGEAAVRLNAEIAWTESDFVERSLRTPSDPGQDPFRLDRGSDSTSVDYEIGGDFEWTPAANWQSKIIGLHRGESDDNEDQELLILEPSPPGLQRIATRESTDSETIGRLEIDWSGRESHLLELDVETALNTLDNLLVLRINDAGRLVPVEVPGANNRVEELRGDVQLRDTWNLGPFSIESALGAEASRISQTRGADREFFFFKPSFSLIHAPREETLNRLSVARRIAQLDFGDFVSSANFGDDDIDRGNPSLEPQQTWRAEAATERRFGSLGVAKLSAFHDWVSDVQDLLPVDDRFEVPGNIGDGRRWGLTLESTLPLDRLGVERARLDLDARWQGSTVTDPVTGRDRRFSGQRRYALESEFRQDFIRAGWAWGLETEFEDRSVRYELEELDLDDRGIDVEAFVETTRYFGVKLQLIAQNLLDREFRRDRTVFVGTRSDGEIDFREVRDRRRGRSVLLTVSGTF